MTALDYLVLAGIIAGIILTWANFRVHNHYDRDSIQMVSGAIIFIAVVCVVIVRFIEWGPGGTCRAKAEALGRDFKFDIWSECLIEADNGDFVPLDNLRFNEDGEV